MGKKSEEKACQMKVQDAVGMLVNGAPLPSFLTIPQMTLLQSALTETHQIEIVSITHTGASRNITTKTANPLS
jgi:hypothetical protein